MKRIDPKVKPVKRIDPKKRIDPEVKPVKRIDPEAKPVKRIDPKFKPAGCSRRDHVVYIKSHKTGSSTFAMVFWK